jgi:glucose-1-phosphate cytidylyltransferase
MKVVILAGGYGTRLAEETDLIPKPMVDIGGRAILCHIMKHYAWHGFSEFVVALGYKGEMIKAYFLDYTRLQGNLSISLADGAVSTHGPHVDDWTVHLIDTGLQSMTGGRLKRLEPWLAGSAFMLTYGDGVCNVDLRALYAFHRAHGKLATITAVRPPARFGGLESDASGRVTQFIEKPQIGEGWINGGYMVIEPEVLARIEGDATVLERDVLEGLASEGQLVAFRHEGFWQCMDTIRDKRLLEGLWQGGKAPWKIWKD